MSEEAKTPREVTGDRVHVLLKTPFVPRPVHIELPAQSSVGEALNHVRDMAAKDPETKAAVEQLRRETSAAFDLLAAGAEGAVTRIASGTRLGDLAVEREFRTRDGLTKAKVAAVQVQAYAPVGAGCV